MAEQIATPTPTPAPPPDLGVLSVLAEQLWAEVLAELAFEERFAPLGALYQPAVRPIVRVPPGRPCAWLDNGSLQATTAPGWSGGLFGSTAQLPRSVVGLQVGFDQDPSQTEWGADDRAEAVRTLADGLAEIVWGHVEWLFGHSPASPASRAADDIAFDVGPAEAAHVELPNGVEVLYHPQALVFGCDAACVVARLPHEGDDGDAIWYLLGRLSLYGHLRLDGARRLYASGPGPTGP